MSQKVTTNGLMDKIWSGRTGEHCSTSGILRVSKHSKVFKFLQNLQFSSLGTILHEIGHASNVKILVCKGYNSECEEMK